MAVIVSSSAAAAAFILLLVVSADGQLLKGIMPKNGSEAFLAAEMCYLQRSVVDGEAKLTKTAALLTAVSSTEMQIEIDKTLSPLCSSSGVLSTSKPPTPHQSPAADKRGLSWRAKAWCCWFLAVAMMIVVFVVRPETFLVSPARIDAMFIADDDGDPPVDGNEHTTMDAVPVRGIPKVSVDSCETRPERLPAVSASPRIDTMLIADSNGDSLVDGELFYCPMCMETVPIILKSGFGSCDHAFCSSCVAKYVAVEQRQGVAPVECPDCQDGAPMLNTHGDGNEDPPLDGNDGNRFYCAKCMHVVPCGCVRPSYTLCTHDFCPSCVARRTSRLQGRRPRAGKQLTRHHPTDLLPVDMLRSTEGNGDLLVGGDGELFDCAICMETVASILKFSVNSCGHTFCSSCVAQYIAAKLDDKVARVGCPHPGCKGGPVELERCHGIIPTDLLDRWGFLLCELAVGAQRMYCPYRECSALLLVDGEAGAAAISEAECPHCHRLFCARCAVPWHDGFGCDEFLKLGLDERGREDLLLRRLVGRQGWQRCPKCQMFVEKSEGCNYIKCRCGCSFCYRCASVLTSQSHYCNKCKR